MDGIQQGNRANLEKNLIKRRKTQTRLQYSLPSHHTKTRAFPADYSNASDPPGVPPTPFVDPEFEHRKLESRHSFGLNALESVHAFLSKIDFEWRINDFRIVEDELRQMGVGLRARVV